MTSKEKTYVNVLVSNYTNNHITFNKGEHVGHLDMPIEDIQQTPEDSGSLTTQSITTKKMMAEKVELDTFKPPLHKLRMDIKTKLEELLKEYQYSLHRMKLPIGTTLLTMMLVDMGDSEPVSHKPYPIAMKHYKWVKDKIK